MIYAEHILVCVSVPLVIALAFTRGSARRFAGFALTGMVICLMSAYISGFADSGSDINTSVYVSPILEEIMKLLPPLLYLYLMNPEDDDLMLAGVGVGTGFAIFENCCYLTVPEMERFAFVAIRGFSTGVMHVVSAVSLCLGLTLARRIRALTLPGIIGALSLSATFHGLYNLLVSHSGTASMIGYAMPVLTAAMLLPAYRKTRQK